MKSKGSESDSGPTYFCYFPCDLGQVSEAVFSFVNEVNLSLPPGLLLLFFKSSSKGTFFIAFRENEEEGERNIHKREDH